MATARPYARRARFDRFEINLATGELRRSGQRIPLQEQPFRILRLLVEAAPEVVTREQISSTLWPSDTFVDFELAINTAVRKLRQALDDSVDNPKFIQTLAKRGYRFIPSVSWADRDAKQLDSTTLRSVERDYGRRRPHWRQLVLRGVGLAVVVLTAWQIWQHRFGREPDLTSTPLTAFPGTVGSPSFSPDGQEIAFGWDQDKPWPSAEVFVQMIGSSEHPLQLTHMPSWIGQTAWSPDGHSIAYDRILPTPSTEEKPSEIVTVPALPGPETVLTPCYLEGLCGVSWSGKYIAFRDQEQTQEPTAIFVLNTETRERSRLTVAPKGSLGDANPIFSHDGKQIAFIRILTEGTTQLGVFTLASKKVRMLQTNDTEITGLAWDTENRDIIYAGNRTGIPALWRVSASGGEPRMLSVGADAASVAVSDRAHRLVYTRGSINTNIWRVQLGGKEGQRTKLIASSRQEVQPTFSPDGTKIAFTSNRSGPQEIWISRADGSDVMQLTRLANRHTGTPQWSPDGNQIVFDSRHAGHSNIYIVAANGGFPRQITDGPFDSSTPSWSRDGRSVYYSLGAPYAGTSDTQVWNVPAIGGKPFQVTQRGGEIPMESPDGRTLYYVNPKNDSEIWQKTLPDGEEQQTVDILSLSNSMSWQVKKDGIYFTDSGFGTSMQPTLRFFSFATRKTTILANLGRVAFGISVSSDGRTVLYSQQDHVGSDIMLVENFH